MPPPPTRHPFIESLRVQFPELSPAIDSFEVVGLLYLEVGVFSHYTFEAFNAGDLEAVREYFVAVEAALEDADDDLRGAILVQYAEDFVLGSAEQQAARSLMPPRLRDAFDEVAAWHGVPTSRTGARR